MNLSYVCLSDLHLGASTSLLTDTPAVANEPTHSAKRLRDAFAEAFTKTLAALGTQAPSAAAPDLVLLGDIFDMSLGTPKSSIETFDKLLKSLASHGARGQLGSCAFLPGNHDHELWTVSRFTHMVAEKVDDDIYTHITPAFANPDSRPRAALIDQLLRDNGFAGASTFYPNMGLMTENADRMVIFHHGHFIEPVYRAMSTLTMMLDGRPEILLNAESLERENASWIDFLWSTDGDDGRLGAEIMFAHDALLTGRDDILVQHRLADILTRKIAAALPLPHTAKAREGTKTAARAIVDSVLGTYGQMERFSYQQTLGADGRAGLISYLSDTVRKQIEQEKPGTVPSELSFVFGHTHKPFEQRLSVPGYTVPPAVYNTGGWSMDTPMFGTRLGASAMFVDSELNLAALRLCDVPQDDDAVPGCVRVATADGTLAGNPLAQALHEAVNDAGDAWHAFTKEAAAAYRIKQAFIMAQLRARDGGDCGKEGAA
ncbi:MAG: metallophosphoesterase [Paracoccaceae bacterium]